MAGGLGLGDFLRHDPDAEKAGGGRGWLDKWKEKGEIILWLHTRAPIYPVWSHTLMLEDSYEDKETQKTKDVLRFPRYVSPDANVVHVNQFFREDDGRMRVLPDRDPFLLVREHLRALGNAGVDWNTVVFSWTDFKNRNALIEWELGKISGLEKRGQDWNKSLDTKLEFIFTVVADSDPGKGPVLTRETKLLAEKVREMIKNEIDSKGVEAGDPMISPYAMKWKFDKNAKSPMNSYSAFRFDRAECTDEVWNAIGGPEDSEAPPDASDIAKFKDADLVKIRASMEKAAQIELPFDAIFSEDPEVRRAVALGQYARGAKTISTPATPPPAQRQTSGGPTRPGASSGATRPGPATRTQAPATTQAPAQRRVTQAAAQTQTKAEPAPSSAPSSSGPASRRRKVAEAAPPPPKEPEVEKIPCDECGEPMLPTATECPKCGAQYDVTPEAATVEAGGERDAEGEPVASCWSCGSKNLEGNKCKDCGIDQGDNIPFS